MENLTREYIDQLMGAGKREVKFKKMHPDAVLPLYSKVGDAGMDLTAVTKVVDHAHGFVEYGTGLVPEIPEGFVGLIFPRSSISKTYYTLSNSVGVLDSNYRGEIKFRFFYNSTGVFQILSNADVLKEQGFENEEYKVGDRIGQLIIIPYPTITPIWAEELSNTERGEGGFGSTGK